MTRLAVPRLAGRHVALEPMTLDHVDAIAAAGAGDRSTFGYTQVPDGRDEAAEYVRWLLDDAAHDGGDHVIFVGEVLRMSHDPRREPLLYCRGRYARLADEG